MIATAANGCAVVDRHKEHDMIGAMVDVDDLHVKVGDEKRIHCNQCQVRTNHQLEAYHRSPTEWLALDTMEVMDVEIEDDS
jgi:hypothetical protein